MFRLTIIVAAEDEINVDVHDLSDGGYEPFVDVTITAIGGRTNGVSFDMAIAREIAKAVEMFDQAKAHDQEVSEPEILEALHANG